MIFIHVSELAIDRLLAGEVAPADADAMRDHAATCARCGALMADALATQAAFTAHRPPLRLPSAPPVAPAMVKRRTAVVAIATTAALAAGVVGVIAWPHAAQQQRELDQLVRTKGAAIVGFYVSNRGEIRRGTARERVAPGDHVQLFTSTTTDSWFAAISIDGRGQRSTYVPVQHVPAGQEHSFGMSIELDDALGAETVTGVFCEQPFDAATIDLAHPPSGCTTDRFVLDKAVR